MKSIFLGSLVALSFSFGSPLPAQHVKKTGTIRALLVGDTNAEGDVGKAAAVDISCMKRSLRAIRKANWV